MTSWYVLGHVLHQGEHAHVDAVPLDVAPAARVDLEPPVGEDAMLEVGLRRLEAGHERPQPDGAVVALERQRAVGERRVAGQLERRGPAVVAGAERAEPLLERERGRRAARAPAGAGRRRGGRRARAPSRPGACAPWSRAGRRRAARAGATGASGRRPAGRARPRLRRRACSPRDRAATSAVRAREPAPASEPAAPSRSRPARACAAGAVAVRPLRRAVRRDGLRRGLAHVHDLHRRRGGRRRAPPAPTAAP